MSGRRKSPVVSTPVEPEQQRCPTCDRPLVVHLLCACPRARRVKTPACPACAKIQQQRIAERMASFTDDGKRGLKV